MCVVRLFIKISTVAVTAAQFCVWTHYRVMLAPPTFDQSRQPAGANIVKLLMLALFLSFVGLFLSFVGLFLSFVGLFLVIS